VTLATPLLEKFWGVMSGLSLETLVPNLKSVVLTVFEILAFNAEKNRGHVTLATPPFGKKFWGSCPGSPWEDLCQISSPSVALTVFELLAFNSH